MDLQLSGRSAVVTGSSSGIGEAIATQLAEEGARVMIHGRNQERATRVRDSIRAAGGEAWSCCADLATDEGARILVAAARRELGDIEILINNAGSYDFESSWLTLSADDWLERFNVNAGSALRVTSLLVADMKELGWGRIVNIGSTDAAGPEAAPPDYAMSKAALANMTITLARECHASGVTANTVTPGYVLTETVLTYLRVVAQARAWAVRDDEELAARALRDLFGEPRGGWGRPSDVAYVVAMLCSPRVDWMTAAEVRLDGGGITPLLARF